MVTQNLSYKPTGVADYLQRSARHLASATDVKMAFYLGESAVKQAVKGLNGAVDNSSRDSWRNIQMVYWTYRLAKVANCEKTLPEDLLRKTVCK